MTFYNEAARHAYEQKRNSASQKYRKQQAEQELAALLERVPEQLDWTYKVIQESDGRVIVKSDRVSHLAASACVTEFQIRWAIDTGEPFQRGSRMCQGGGELYWVAPVGG